jgi:hypothetical protein
MDMAQQRHNSSRVVFQNLRFYGFEECFVLISIFWIENKITLVHGRSGHEDRRAPPAAQEQGPGGGAAQGPMPVAAGGDQDAQRCRPIPARGAGARAQPPPPGRYFHAHQPDPVPRAGARLGSFFPCHNLAACYLLLRLGC